MADLSEAYAALQKADAAGDTAGAKQLADYIRSQSAAPRGGQSFDTDGQGNVIGPTGSPQAHAAQSPISDSSFENFRAGAGKATIDLGRGIGQGLSRVLGPQGNLVSRQDVADSRERDAPLMGTRAGQAGVISGTVADLLPTMFIPGANTMGGSALIGAASGALQPSVSTGETAGNTFRGALGGPLGLVAGRALGVGYNALKSTAQPFFNAGQDAIASRTLQTFAGGEEAAQNALTSITSPRNILPGVQPTTAELANNAGLSQLERQLSINPDTLNQMTVRNQSNAAAMRSGLADIAGTPDQMQAALEARSAVSKPLYEAASNVQVAPDSVLSGLMQRPSMQGAMSRARSLAAERGDTMGTEATTSSLVPQTGFDSMGVPMSMPPAVQSATSTMFNGKNIQYLKMALNDMASSGPQNGMGSHEVAAVKGTLGSLNEWTQANVPALRQADAAYASASKPINQMQIGQQLSNKLNPALSDFGDVPRLNANSYAQAVRNGDSIAADVTGNKAATLANSLSPEQMQTVTQIGEQLARRATATDLGRATGSNTAQNLVSQNMLRQILGPMGLPESWGESVAKNTLAQSVMRPMQFVAKAGEGKVLDRLSNAALNPAEAQRLLQMNVDPNVAKLIWARQALLGSLGSSAGLLGNSQQ